MTHGPSQARGLIHVCDPFPGAYLCLKLNQNEEKVLLSASMEPGSMH